MLKAAKWLIVAALVLALAWWIGGLPGDVTAHSGPYVITTSTPAALLLLFMISVVFVVMLRVLGGVYRTPRNLAAWRGGKKAAAGEIAAQRGLVAVAAGDAVAAKAEAGRARKLLGETPLVLWLHAEAARLAGDAAAAKAAFTALTRHKEMRYLGHQGLLRASLEAADHEAAAQHAQNAEDAYPGAAWTRTQRLELAVKAGNFAGALALTQAPREVAALATAAAQNAATARQALDYAQRALKTVPAFPPAVVAAVQALRALGNDRAARKLVLAGWKQAPQPMLAAAWFAPEATKLERAQAAVVLAAANPGHVESELVLAGTAQEAGLLAEARRHAQLAVSTGQDDGRAENILAGLEGKPGVPVRSAWVCDACRHAAAAWAPLCPACGKLGTLEWRAPGTAVVRV